LISRDKLEDAIEEVEVDGRWTGMFRVNYGKLCSQEKCRRMAQELYNAGEDRWGTDETTFNRVFSTQDYYTLRMVWDEYVKVSEQNGNSRVVLYCEWMQISQRDIINSVERETSGDLLAGLRAIGKQWFEEEHAYFSTFCFIFSPEYQVPTDVFR
jgi:annexin A7/11